MELCSVGRCYRLLGRRISTPNTEIPIILQSMMPSCTISPIQPFRDQNSGIGKRVRFITCTCSSEQDSVATTNSGKSIYVQEDQEFGFLFRSLVGGDKDINKPSTYKILHTRRSQRNQVVHKSGSFTVAAEIVEKPEK